MRFCCLVAVALGLVGCGEEGTAPPGDMVAPAAVENLMAVPSAAGTVTLSWTAPGDDGIAGQASSYDLRFSTNSFNEGTWDSATVVPSPTPTGAGIKERLIVSDLPDAELYFGLKTADEIPNWSGLSNIAFVSDPVPPGVIEDLRLKSVGPWTVDLEWSAPDAAKGREIVEYDIRVASKPLTSETWKSGTKVEDTPSPGRGGEIQTVRVSGLERGTRYFFGCISVDDFGQRSGISNVVEATTNKDVEVQLTFGPSFSYVGSADWSPEGDELVYGMDQTDQGSQIYKIPASSPGNGSRLTNTQYGSAVPRWSPDGLNISTTAWDSEGLAELQIVDSSSGAVRSVIFPSPGQSVQNHAWSPDGEQLAFTVAVQRIPVTVSDLYVVSTSGGTPRRISGGWDYPAGIDWSPDGRRIAYASSEGGDTNIWVTSIDGLTRVQLTSDPGSDVGCSWHPNGQKILFSSNRSGNFDLWEIPAAGGTPVQVTSSEVDEWGGRWSPDGRTICFVRPRPSNTGVDLWVLDVDGAN